MFFFSGGHVPGVCQGTGVDFSSVAEATCHSRSSEGFQGADVCEVPLTKTLGTADLCILR